jgi:D-alanyl-D-alanine carboxypeptidase
MITAAKRYMAAALLSAALLSAAWAPRESAEELQALVDGCIDPDGEDPVHNTLMLVKSPGFEWKGAAGLADGENETMLPDHKFKIASIGKTFTAVLILRLVEEGVIGLDDTLGEFFKNSTVVPLDSLDVYEGTSYGRLITVRQLLGHTSGLMCFLGDDPRFIEYIVENPGLQWTPEMMLAKYFEYHLNRKAPFPPGRGWWYADTNYLLLAMIVEEVTGSPLHEQYRKYILEPLDMGNTYLEFYEEPRGSGTLSHAYFGRLDVVAQVNTSFDWGGGGLVSTAKELDTFFRAVASGGIFEKDSTLDEMLAGTEREDHWNYGLGIKKITMGGLDFYGHPGAYGCDIYYCPDEDITICTTINQMNSHGQRERLRETGLEILRAGIGR